MVEFYYTGNAEAEKKSLLQNFVLSRPLASGNRSYFQKELSRIKQETMGKTGKVCMVLDESGTTGIGLMDFFAEVMRIIL